jgi:hypothetical protein
MESGTGTGGRRSMVSDTELLRTIVNDLRVIYAEVIKQPLPRNIKDALARIDREQGKEAYRGRRVAL